MFKEVMTRCTSHAPLWKALAILLSVVVQADGLFSHVKNTDNTLNRSIQVAGINIDGGVFYSGTKDVVDDAVVIRREARVGQTATTTVVSRTGEVLFQMKEATGSAKIVIVVIVSLIALVSFCTLAVWLVWAPMNAIFEERVYEQAARQAFMEAAPTAPIEQPEGVTEPLLPTQEQNLAHREEQIALAWKKFLDNPLLHIKRTNILARSMHKLLGDPGFNKQMEDLFSGLTAEGEDTIKRSSLERAVEGISGTIYNMHVKDRISNVKFVKEIECSMAVADVEEDYGWLFHKYDIVFPEHLPMERKCFAGVMKLVIVWNCVRTLHTARHVKVEHHDKGKSRSSQKDMSHKVAVHVKIDARQGFPLEADAEIVVEDDAKSTSDEDGTKAASSSTNDASASASADPKLKRKDSWSDNEKESAPAKGGDDDEAVAP